MRLQVARQIQARFVVYYIICSAFPKLQNKSTSHVQLHPSLHPSAWSSTQEYTGPQKQVSAKALNGSYRFLASYPRPAPAKSLLEVVESRHQEELLQEEFRIQHSDVSGSADQGVGSIGQGVEHVVSDQSAVLGFHQGAQKVVDHFCINRPWKEGRRM